VRVTLPHYHSSFSLELKTRDGKPDVSRVQVEAVVGYIVKEKFKKAVIQSLRGCDGSHALMSSGSGLRESRGL